MGGGVAAVTPPLTLEIWFPGGIGFGLDGSPAQPVRRSRMAYPIRSNDNCVILAQG